MCDTLVALGNSTKDGSVIFGKNSDRPSDEVQLITHVPRTKHEKGTELKCTYITIPQVLETAEIFLSLPWWMWGAEMGSNEYNVVIGNEAIHTEEPLRRSGLLGMDLLRLGLERGKTAKEAVDVIIALLAEFGQGGGCAYGDSSWMYHNSFLVADSKEGYILEAADMWWIVEKVKNVRSISNGISIRGKGDMRRDGIIQHAINNGYCKDDDDFDFASTFSGGSISDNPSPYSRGGKSTILLTENKGNITSSMMMEFLREHDAGICMHGGFESTGSQVSHLRDGNRKAIHWFTGSTLPCTSLYKPYIFPNKSRDVLKPGPYSKINQDWFWIKHTKYIDKLKRNKSRSEIIDYFKKLREKESRIIRKIDETINQEKELSDKDFLKEIESINIESWKASLEMIE